MTPELYLFIGAVVAGVYCEMPKKGETTICEIMVAAVLWPFVCGAIIYSTLFKTEKKDD